jgi:hypothetical protein
MPLNLKNIKKNFYLAAAYSPAESETKQLIFICLDSALSIRFLINALISSVLDH